MFLYITYAEFSTLPEKIEVGISFLRGNRYERDYENWREHLNLISGTRRLKRLRIVDIGVSFPFHLCFANLISTQEWKYIATQWNYSLSGSRIASKGNRELRRGLAVEYEIIFFPYFYPDIRISSIYSQIVFNRGYYSPIISKNLIYLTDSLNLNLQEQSFQVLESSLASSFYVSLRIR